MLDHSDKTFMLFKELPISLDCLEKKFFLTEDIYIDKNAQEIIAYVENLDINIAYAIYPQYRIPGLGFQHRLFCADLNQQGFVKIRQGMFEIVGLLRLIKPLSIHITGALETRNNQISTFETIWYNTCLNIPQSTQIGIRNMYYSDDLSHASQLWKRFYSNPLDPNLRLQKAVNSFIQTSTWASPVSVSSLFQNLFPIIDLLSGNPSWNQIKYVTDNLGKWLQWVYEKNANLAGIDLEQVVELLWDMYRNYYLHLSCSVALPSHLYIKNKNGSFDYKGENPYQDMGDALIALHELIRLCLLALLYLPEEQLLAFNSLPKVEMRLSKTERGIAEKERMEATQNYYKTLMDKNIRPSLHFWLDGIHCRIFSKLFKK